MNDFKLSVSKLKTFADCKAKYKFCYVLKLPRKERDYHVFGKFCHQVLEFFHQQYIEGCLLPYHITIADSFKKAWSEYKDKMTKEMKQEAFDIINQYLKIVSTDNKKTSLPGNVIAVEKRFDFHIAENLILNGAIDRIQLDDDNMLHISDYKTTKNKKYLRDDFFQLLTYAHVLLAEDPSIERIRASYILLRHDFEYITTEFGKEEILAVKDKYIDYANKINTENEFIPNPTILCNYCDYQLECPSGLTMQRQDKKFGEVEW